jgi:hypothetical protein
MLMAILWENIQGYQEELGTAGLRKSTRGKTGQKTKKNSDEMRGRTAQAYKEDKSRLRHLTKTCSRVPGRAAEAIVAQCASRAPFSSNKACIPRAIASLPYALDPFGIGLGSRKCRRWLRLIPT